MNHRLLSLVSITALVTAADAFATQTPPQTPTQPSQPIRTGGGSASQTPTDSKGRTAPSRPIQRDGRGGQARPPAAAGGHGPIAPNQGDVQAMRPQLRTIFTWRSPIRPSEANPWPTGSWHSPSMWVVDESALRGPNGSAQTRPRIPVEPTDGATIATNADIKLGADTQIHTLQIGSAEVRLSGSRLAVEELSVASPAAGERRSLTSGKWVPRLTLSSILEVMTSGRSSVNDIALKTGGGLLFRGAATITRVEATEGTTIKARRSDDALAVGRPAGGKASETSLTLNEASLTRCGVEAPVIRWASGLLEVEESVLSAGTIDLAGDGKGRVSAGSRIEANALVVGPDGSIEFESGSVVRATDMIATHGGRAWDALKLGGVMNTRHFLAMQPNRVTAEILDSGRLKADALVCIGWRSSFPLLRISGTNTDLGIFNPPEALAGSGGSSAASRTNPFLLSSVERLSAVPAQAEVGRALLVNGAVELGHAGKDEPGHLRVNGDLTILSGLLVTNGSLVKADAIEIAPAPEGVPAAGVLRELLPALDQERMPEALQEKVNGPAPKGDHAASLDAMGRLYGGPFGQGIGQGAEQAALLRRVGGAMRQGHENPLAVIEGLQEELSAEHAAALRARYEFYYSQIRQPWAKAHTIDEKLSALWAAEAAFVAEFPAHAIEVETHAAKATGIVGYPSREEADRLRRDPGAWMSVHVRLGMHPPADPSRLELQPANPRVELRHVTVDPQAMTELGFRDMIERAGGVPLANGALRGWGLLDSERVSNSGHMRIEHEPSYWQRWFGGAHSVSHGAALGGSLGDFATYGFLVSGSYEQKADGVLSVPVSGANKVRYETHAGRYVSNLSLAASVGAPVARGALRAVAQWVARIGLVQSLIEVMRLSPTGVADMYPLIASDASFEESKGQGQASIEAQTGVGDFGSLRLRVDPAETIEVGDSYRVALLAGPVTGRPTLGRSCNVPNRDDAFFALDVGPIVERSLSNGIQPTAQTVVDARVLSVPRRVSEFRPVQSGTLSNIAPTADEPMTRAGQSPLYGVPMRRKLLIATHGQDSAIEQPSVWRPRSGVGAIADIYAEFARQSGLDREWDVVTFDWSQYATGEHDTHGWRNVSMVASEPVVDELVGRSIEQIFRLPAVRSGLSAMSGARREQVGAVVGGIITSTWEGPSFGDGYEASRVARQIGISLADWMMDSGMGYESLEEVHFIAEGSSVWMADAFSARLNERSAEWPSGRAPAVHITAFNAFSNAIDQWIPVGQLSRTAVSFEHFADSRWLTLTGNEPARLSPNWMEVDGCDPALLELRASSLDGSPETVGQRLAASVQGAAAWPTEWYRLSSRAAADRAVRGGVEPIPSVPTPADQTGAVRIDCADSTVGFVHSPMYRDFRALSAR
jgi:hypothetical protein